jgi:NAD+ diphosphatase
MIQDIFPHRFDNSYRNLTVTANDKILIFHDDQSALKTGSGEVFYTFDELKNIINIEHSTFTYLFSIDESRYFLLQGTDIKSNNLLSTNIQTFRTLKPRHEAFAGITGHHLYHWYNNNRFCGHCGRAMSHSNHERALLCQHCNSAVYPRISPAVIIGVTNGSKLLMARNKNGVYSYLALLAGFCEIGETLEQTVEREVFEETGLRVKNITYYKSQPWAFSGSILAGFYAELDGSDKIKLDTNELTEAGWFERDQIPTPPLNISLTSEMIMSFKNNTHQATVNCIQTSE